MGERQCGQKEKKGEKGYARAAKGKINCRYLSLGTKTKGKNRSNSLHQLARRAERAFQLSELVTQLEKLGARGLGHVHVLKQRLEVSPTQMWKTTMLT